MLSAEERGSEGQNTALEDDLKMKIDLVEEEKTQLDLEWVPETITKEGVEELVRISGDQQATVVRTIASGNGTWRAVCSAQNEIPHYIQLKNLKFTKYPHTILTKIKGRRQACEHCGDDQHWSNKCNSKKSPWQRKETTNNQQFNRSSTSYLNDYPALATEEKRHPLLPTPTVRDVLAIGDQIRRQSTSFQKELRSRCLPQRR